MQSSSSTELRSASERSGISSCASSRRRICTRRSCRTRWISSAFAARRCANICARFTAAARAPGGRGRSPARMCITSPADPYAIEIEAVDSLLPGEVAVVGTQKSVRNAPWGELAVDRGAEPAVRAARSSTDLVRDVRKIEEIGFPVFAAGIKPVDSMGRGIVTAYNIPVECGEVIVSPGDFVFADFDGIVVVPRQIGEGSHRTRDGQSSAREQLAARVDRRRLPARRLQQVRRALSACASPAIETIPVRVPIRAGVPDSGQPRVSPRIAVPHLEGSHR